MERKDLNQNERGIRRLEIALVILALSFYLLCLASASAFADDNRQFAAAAPLAHLKPEGRNGDFLNDVTGAPKSEASLNSAIFDKTISDEMKAKFNSFNTAYEIKQTYHLNGMEDYVRYQQANQDLAEWTVKKLLQYHFENTLKNNVEEGAKRAAKDSKSSGVQSTAQAVMTISKVQKAISNTTFNIGQDTKTRFKYDFPSGIMRMGMTGPIVEATVDYRMKPADPVVGAVEQPEKLSVGMNRVFKDLGASTNLRYGLINETLNYGASKHIAGPLSAQIDQAHKMRETWKDETIGRLNIGMNF